jgi:NAD(P)H-dependent FMN reductase
VPHLHVIAASVRSERACLPIAQWFVEFARSHGHFTVRLVDLKEINLPLLDEPHHPRLQKYQYDHTKAWSAIVREADAYVFVTPEYNFGPPPALINALDYVYLEWNYKAAGFVSYGGLSGGTRSVQVTKQVVTTLKMMPMFEAVNIPFFAQFLKDGTFQSSDSHQKAATAMLDELARWTGALASLRGV